MERAFAEYVWEFVQRKVTENPTDQIREMVRQIDEIRKREKQGN